MLSMTSPALPAPNSVGAELDQALTKSSTRPSFSRQFARPLETLIRGLRAVALRYAQRVAAFQLQTQLEFASGSVRRQAASQCDRGGIVDRCFAADGTTPREVTGRGPVTDRFAVVTGFLMVVGKQFRLSRYELRLRCAPVPARSARAALLAGS